MTVHRPIWLTPGSLFFTPELPICVNRAEESFQLQEHAHDFIEICIVAEGEGEHYIGGTHFKVAKGDLFYIPVGVSHVFRPRAASPKGRLAVYNCIFTREYLEGAFGAFPLEPDIPSFYEGLERQGRWLAVRDSNGEAGRLLQRLHLESSERTTGYSALLHSGLIELLVLLRRLDRVRSSAPVPTGGSGIRELLERIERDCAGTVRAGELAAELGISVRQLQRSVRGASGMSLTEYVQNARIKECCRLLGETSDKIGHIAAAVGYQDLKFFNRLFKERTGMTPSEYRERSRPSSGATGTGRAH